MQYLEALDGYKTYLCAIAVVLIGAAAKFGLIDSGTFQSMAVIFLGMMGASLRSAVSK